MRSFWFDKRPARPGERRFHFFERENKRDKRTLNNFIAQTY